jgi:hypothetical protein
MQVCFCNSDVHDDDNGHRLFILLVQFFHLLVNQLRL